MIEAHLATALLALSMLALSLASIYPMAYLDRKVIPALKRVANSKRHLETRLDAALVAAYQEPVEVFEETIKSLHDAVKTIITVWDGVGSADAEKVLRKYNRGGVFVSRPRGEGKATALNIGAETSCRRGLRELLIIDVGDVLWSLKKKSCDVVVGLWWPKNPRRGIEEPVSIALSFAAATLYFGRWVRRRPILFLGSGSVVEPCKALAVGGWSNSFVLEDLEFGIRALRGGLSVCFEPGLVVKVGVPETYAAFRLQQAKWALGAAQLLRKRLGSLLRTRGGLELVLYFSQYALLGVWHPLFTVAALLGAPPTAVLVAVVYTLLLLGMVGAKYLSFIVSVWGRKRLEALRLSSSVSALGLVLAPSLTVGLVAGLLGLHWRPVTPKAKSRRYGAGSLLRLLLPETAYMAVTVLSAAFSSSALASVMILLYPLALAYVIVRYHEQIM